jgi:glycosyltransferase involved in cell wall biosynthesis
LEAHSVTSTTSLSRRESALAEKLDAAGIRTISIPSLGRDVDVVEDLRSFRSLLEILAKEQPDVVHLNSSKMGGLGALAARVSNARSRMLSIFSDDTKVAKIVFTGHGWAFNEDRTDLGRFLVGCGHWLTIHLAHRTIAVSRKTREQVSALPLSWHKISVVHNGVDRSPKLEREEALKMILGERAELLIREQPLIVGTLAELHRNKGLAYAIEGFAHLKKYTESPVLLLILGEGEERESLEQMIQRLDLSGSVILAGHKEEADTLLGAFDAFLLPSITEAFPSALLEAGRSGLPIIATAVGGIPEVIDDMESGILIQSRNPGEVARAVHYLLEHPKRRAEFGAEIKKRIEGKFNLENMVSATLEIYEGDDSQNSQIIKSDQSDK